MTLLKISEPQLVYNKKHQILSCVNIQLNKKNSTYHHENTPILQPVMILQYCCFLSVSYRLSPVVVLNKCGNPLGLWIQISGESHQVVQLAFQLLSHRLRAVQALQYVLNNTK